VDAASHVAAYREDLTNLPPATWAELFEKAQQGMQFALPLRGVHALMALLTLLASMGAAMDAEAAEREQGAGLPCDTDLLNALHFLREITSACVPESLNWNPLEALVALSEGACDCLPLTFGYAHFQRRGIRFAGIPAVVAGQPPRPILGGTGMAVSARRPHVATALALANFASSAAVQVGLWPQHGGQPAHREAWRQLAETDRFYRDTASSLRTAYVRPRCLGWNRFQTSAGDAINRWLAGGTGNASIIVNQVRKLWCEATSSNNPTTDH
jgi:multiple sugar transport system substrate-binding protein